MSLRLLGISISDQASRLGERLLEFEGAVVGRDQIWEVHREVSFCSMAGDSLPRPFETPAAGRRAGAVSRKGIGRRDALAV